ncbi:MAG TPA: TetR/AcrR family transcriptional regulator [Cellulomonas sp.]
MPGRTTRPARGAEHKDAIVESAARAFDRVGFAATSLKEVAAEAGTDQGVLRALFARKDDLARAVIDEYDRRMIAALDHALLRHGPLEALIHSSRAIADQLVSDPMMRAGSRLSMELGALDPAVAGHYRAWIEQVTGLFARAQEAGDIAERLDPAELAATVQPYLCGVQMFSALLTDRSDLHARLVVLWRTVIDAAAPLGRRLGLHAVTRDAFGELAVTGERAVVAGAA